MLGFDPPVLEQVRCHTCREPFDETSWEARHTIPDGTTSRGVSGDVAVTHDGCCPICQGDPA